MAYPFVYQKPDFDKTPSGLIPAIVQDASTRQVLMLGYMNQEALNQTANTGLKENLLAIHFRFKTFFWIATRTAF
jgi:phosphoribosyl-ATP pyrophosphohydrolase/phosphoribosyl-AMP cyclohydrolase